MKWKTNNKSICMCVGRESYVAPSRYQKTSRDHFVCVCMCINSHFLFGFWLPESYGVAYSNRTSGNKIKSTWSACHSHIDPPTANQNEMLCENFPSTFITGNGDLAFMPMTSKCTIYYDSFDENSFFHKLLRISSFAARQQNKNKSTQSSRSSSSQRQTPYFVRNATCTWKAT